MVYVTELLLNDWTDFDDIFRVFEWVSWLLHLDSTDAAAIGSKEMLT